LNGALIRYVCEVKPYEIDALVSALLLLTGACLLRRWRTGDLLCFMAAAMIAPWFSYTSCFVSGAVGTTAALQYFSARQPKRALLIAAATGVAALSFLINYYYFCKSPSSAMMAMHRDEWLRLPPRNLSDIRLDGSLLLESLVSPGGFDLPVIGLLLLGLGAAAFFMERNSLGALLGCTVLLGIIGSQAAKYPWTGRLLLFLVPVMCLAAGFGMQFIGQSMERRRFQMTAALICVLTLLPLGYTQFRRTVRPFLHQGAQTAMDLISARAPAGSQVFIDDYSTPVFRFYDRHGEFSARFHVIGSGLFMQDEEVYRQQLLALKGKGKVWVFFPDYYIGGTDHPASVLATLDTIGHREDAIDLFTSKAYLYTF
jgi:hypothetical protein